MDKKRRVSTNGTDYHERIVVPRFWSGSDRSSEGIKDTDRSFESRKRFSQKKVSFRPNKDKLAMIERESEIKISRKYELLGISRSSHYCALSDIFNVSIRDEELIKRMSIHIIVIWNFLIAKILGFADRLYTMVSNYFL